MRRAEFDGLGGRCFVRRGVNWRERFCFFTQTHSPYMSDSNKSSGLGGLFRELNSLVERLGEAANESRDINRTIRFGDDDSEMSGVFGIQFRTGITRDGTSNVSAQPFGNVRTDDGDEVVVEETREPVADVYDEGEHVLVVAEMPGVDAGDVSVEVDGDVLTLAAASDGHRYRKELLLPHLVRTEPASTEAKHGIVRITLLPVDDASDTGE